MASKKKSAKVRRGASAPTKRASRVSGFSNSRDRRTSKGAPTPETKKPRGTADASPKIPTKNSRSAKADSQAGNRSRPKRASQGASKPKRDSRAPQGSLRGSRAGKGGVGSRAAAAGSLRKPAAGSLRRVVRARAREPFKREVTRTFRGTKKAGRATLRLKREYARIKIKAADPALGIQKGKRWTIHGRRVALRNPRKITARGLAPIFSAASTRREFRGRGVYYAKAQIRKKIGKGRYLSIWVSVSRQWVNNEAEFRDLAETLKQTVLNNAALPQYKNDELSLAAIEFDEYEGEEENEAGEGEA